MRALTVAAFLMSVLTACSSGGTGGSGGGSDTGGSSNGGGTASDGGGTSSDGGGTSADGGGTSNGGNGGSGGGTVAAQTDTCPDNDTGSTNGDTPEVAVSADGVIHLLYSGFSGGVLRYGECASNCGSGSSWHFVTAADLGGLGGFGRLGLDANGHPRVMYLYQLTLNTDPEWRFASCDSACATNAASWTNGLAYSFKSGGTQYESGRHNFTVDAQGRPHLIFPSYEGFQNLTTYLTCASGCTGGTSHWTSVVLDSMVQVLASVATTSTGGLRAIFTGTPDHILTYRECNSGCGTSESNWTPAMNLYYSDSGETRIRVDAQNRVRIAWYQGTTGVAAAANSDNMMLYGWCDTGCATAAANWTGVLIGLAVNDGKDGFDMVLDDTGVPAVSYLGAMTDLSLAICNASCNTVNQTWALATKLETIDSVALQTPPPVPNCGAGHTPQSYWYPGYDSSLAATATGAVIVHQTKEYQECDSANLTEALDLIRVHVL